RAWLGSFRWTGRPRALWQFAAPASSAQRFFGDDQPRRHDGSRRGADTQLTDDAEQHVSLLAAEAGACDGELDGSSRGIFGCFLDARTNTNKVDRLPLSDDRPLERSILQETDARPHIHAAFDACAGDDAVADRGVRISEEDQSIIEQNWEVDPAPLTCVLLVEVATIRAGI